MSANPILIQRRTGYKAYDCSLCGEYGYTSDGNTEDFLVRFLIPVKGMMPNTVRVNLCHTCLRQLEEACYVAHRERLMAGEEVTG